MSETDEICEEMLHLINIALSPALQPVDGMDDTHLDGSSGFGENLFYAQEVCSKEKFLS